MCNIFQVADLAEFDSSSLFSSSASSSSSSSSPFSSSITGIKNWRTILCAKDSLLLSQTGSSDLLDQLDREPALKYAITGDQSVIITPCILPPPKKSVEKWNKARKEYKDLKIQASKNAELKEDDKEKETEKDKSIKNDGIDNTAINTDLEKTNVLTMQKDTESEFTVIAKRQTDVKEVDDEGRVAQSDICELESMGSKLEDDMKSPAAEFDKFHTSPSVDTKEGEDSALLHSTPVLRRGSTELFEPECTPISGEKRALETQSEQGQDFVTPKRVKPLRRLSTNTDSTLRRAILSSQLKVCSTLNI